MHNCGMAIVYFNAVVVDKSNNTIHASRNGLYVTVALPNKMSSGMSHCAKHIVDNKDTTIIFTALNIIDVKCDDLVISAALSTTVNILCILIAKSD